VAAGSQAHSHGACLQFSLIGYSFYLHPLMMPMLREMPRGAKGVGIMSDAVTVVIMGVALVTYSYVGVMGAAAFGADTQGDVMMNHLLPGRSIGTVFVLLMLVYLASSIPPLVITLRSYIDFIVAGASPRFQWSRLVLLTVALIGLPLTLAWQDPGLSEKAFALTGATGVCIVCYIIPVLAHFRLMLQERLPGVRAPHSPRLVLEPLLHVPEAEREAVNSVVDMGLGRMDGEMAEQENIVDSMPPAKYMGLPTTAVGWCLHVIFPLAVLVVGCGLSALALYSAYRQLKY
jgi:Transmembrane amino acid transporter protein